MYARSFGSCFILATQPPCSFEHVHRAKQGSLFSFLISIEGALKRPMTYDNHPIPANPFQFYNGQVKHQDETRQIKMNKDELIQIKMNLDEKDSQKKSQNVVWFMINYQSQRGTTTKRHKYTKPRKIQGRTNENKLI